MALFIRTLHLISILTHFKKVYFSIGYYILIVWCLVVTLPVNQLFNVNFYFSYDIYC